MQCLLLIFDIVANYFVSPRAEILCDSHLGLDLSLHLIDIEDFGDPGFLITCP